MAKSSNKRRKKKGPPPRRPQTDTKPKITKQQIGLYIIGGLMIISMTFGLLLAAFGGGSGLF